MKGKNVAIYVIVCLLAIAILALGFLKFYQKNQQIILKKIDQTSKQTTSPEILKTPVNVSDWKTYKDNKYGYEFMYPQKWFLSDGKLSPEKIETNEIGSDNAPIHFGLYSDQVNNFQYQIDHSKRNKPDSIVKINGLSLKRYDLIDYGSYEGDSAGNVIFFVGPKINNQDIFIVFSWEQFPGNTTLKSNNSQDFIDIVSTLKVKSK